MALTLTNYLLEELADLAQDLQEEDLLTNITSKNNVKWSYNNIVNCKDSPEELIDFINYLTKDLEFINHEKFK